MLFDTRLLGCAASAPVCSSFPYCDIVSVLATHHERVPAAVNSRWGSSIQQPGIDLVTAGPGWAGAAVLVFRGAILAGQFCCSGGASQPVSVCRSATAGTRMQSLICSGRTGKGSAGQGSAREGQARRSGSGGRDSGRGSASMYAVRRRPWPRAQQTPGIGSRAVHGHGPGSCYPVAEGEGGQGALPGA